MAFIVEEIGRTADVNEASNVERVYYAHDYASEAAAGAAVLAHLESTIGNPPNIGGLVLRNIKPDETEVPNSYRVKCLWGPYEKKTPTQTGGNDFSFEFELETVRAYTALETTKYDVPAYGLPAQDHGLAINWNPKDRVAEGIDLLEPVYGWSETHYVTLSTLTAGYKAALAGVVRHTNNGTFRGYPAGEVLCLGPTGQQRGADDFAITFRFKQRPNVTLSLYGVSVPKKGWEYLEVEYDKSDGTGGKKLVPKPSAIRVHRVYDPANFADLGIGT